MKLKSRSYPDKIRRIADDLGKLKHLRGVDQTAEKLRLIANELEIKLKNAREPAP